MFFLQALLFCAFACSQLSNGLLLYLLQTRAGKCLGTYRHLMTVFAAFAMIFNWVDIFTQPIVHIEEQMWAVLNHGPFRYDLELGHFLICIFCGSFGMCISLLATLFIYRYVAICKTAQLFKLQGSKVSVLFLFPGFISTSWFFTCFYLMDMSDDEALLLRDTIMKNYGEEMREVSYMGGMYWTTKGVWNIKDLVGTAALTCLMIICCSTIVFCAIKSYNKMNDESSKIISSRTRALNKQLFITLCLQTLMPYFMLYLPVGLFFYLPLFRLNVGVLANVAGITAAVYPALEPLIAIFCISSFRKTVMRCSRHPSKVSSSVNGPSSVTMM